MDNLKNKFLVIIFIASCATGLALSASIGFHIGLLQELSFSNKLIFIALLSIPLIWLFFFLFTRLIAKTNRKQLLLPLVISFLATTLMMIFVYQEIEPVQIHTFQLYLPEQSNEGSSVALTKAYSRGIVDKDIHIESFEVTGPVNHPQSGEILLLGGSTTNLKQMFSGNLHLVLEPAGCPFYADIQFDETKKSVNLCELNADGEMVFLESTNGILPSKWKLLQIIFVAIDAFLMFILLLCFSCFSCFKIKSWKNTKDKDGHEQLRFFVIAFLSAGFSTALIFWKRVPDLEVFIPIIVMLAGYQIHVLFKKTTWNKFIDISLLVAIFAVGAFVNLWLGRTAYFSSLYASLEPTKNDRGNSYNSLVTTVLKSFPYSLYYGFGEVLINRELVTSQEIITKYQIDTSLVEKLLRADLLIDDENKYLLTTTEYSCLMNKPHLEWTTYQNKRIISLTEDSYSGDERTILIEFQDTLLLLPQSVFSSAGACQ